MSQKLTIAASFSEYIMRILWDVGNTLKSPTMNSHDLYRTLADLDRAERLIKTLKDKVRDILHALEQHH